MIHPPPADPSLIFALLSVAVGLAACLFEATPAAAGEPAGWLNVRDCGASGSEFETVATTEAGSNRIVVEDVGDFEVGQGVMVSRCNIRYEDARLWGPRGRRGPATPLGDRVEMRGYDGSSGSWTVFVLDVDGAEPATFRWSDDLGRTWHGDRTPVDGKWHALSGKTEVRFGELDWGAGYTATFSARDQLATSIEKIEGHVLTLADAANRSVNDAVVRHSDSAALQDAIDRAIQEKRNVYFPVGTYRLTTGVTVKDAGGITIEGSSDVHTVMDISEGVGACFSLVGGTDVTLRNFRMVGHMGFDERDKAGRMDIKGAGSLWGFFLKHCNAVGIRETERVLVESCHASRMSAECFYSQGRSRQGKEEPEQYTRAITYLRCSVVNSARNAFNNNDMAENTSVLNCRVVDVGGCTWEGASRFVKFTGNYVRNSGTVAMGNIGSRAAHFEELGSGQHIVADNVFESGACYGGCVVRAAQGAMQVIIRNNLFVNFGTSAIEILGMGGERWLPARNVTITGNIMDMTHVGEGQPERTAIQVSASDVVVSDNQVYVRGTADPQVTGLKLEEPAVNIMLHDNLVRNCGTGILTTRGQAAIDTVVDPTTFLLTGRGVPLERRQSHCYRGWNLAWLSGTAPNTLSVIESFDPETFHFRLRAPHEMRAGDTFEVFPPSANWKIHNNVINDCLQPVVLDAYGSSTSIFSDNLISRGEAQGVKEALVVRGTFQVLRNHIYGFDEAESVALMLGPDAIGRTCASSYEGNTVEQCAVGVGEVTRDLWKAASTSANRFLGCGSAPEDAEKR